MPPRSTCNRAINESIETVWVQVIGWEKKRDQGGTNHVALRVPQQTFMCDVCMGLRRNGLDPGQRSLL